MKDGLKKKTNKFEETSVNYVELNEETILQMLNYLRLLYNLFRRKLYLNIKSTQKDNVFISPYFLIFPFQVGKNKFERVYVQQV